MSWGEDPWHITWPDQPTFRTVKLSQLIDEADKIIRAKMHLRVTIDIDISYEEANFIKENFYANYKIRELTLIPEKKELEIETNIDIKAFESVDEIVINQLLGIESNNIDKKKLLEIYNNL
jgi:hypothetical protein